MATPAQDRKLRDPSLNPGDQPYFDACAEGKLLIKNAVTAAKCITTRARYARTASVAKWIGCKPKAPA